jgi:prepilin-type processing-associated H-X9-DG protein
MKRWMFKILEIPVHPILSLIASLVVVAFVFWWLSPRVEQRPISAESICRHNLRTIGLALSSYGQRWGYAPPAVVTDAEGLPLYSWRVLLLPYLDQETLYSAYNFRLAWNTAENRTVGSSPVETYLCPSSLSRNKMSTNYLAMVGNDTLWPGSEARSLAVLSRSASEVIQIIEVQNTGIRWIEPRDLSVYEVYPQINLSNGVKLPHPGGTHVLLGDGSVQFVTTHELTSYIKEHALIDSSF